MIDPLDDIRRVAKREQDQREIEELKADIARRQHERVVAEILAPKPPAPPPAPPPPPAPEPKQSGLVTRAALDRDLDALAAIVGEEMGANEKKLRENLERQIADVRTEARAEVLALREQVLQLRQERLFGEAREHAETIPRFLTKADGDAALN